MQSAETDMSGVVILALCDLPYTRYISRLCSLVTLKPVMSARLRAVHTEYSAKRRGAAQTHEYARIRAYGVNGRLEHANDTGAAIRFIPIDLTFVGFNSRRLLRLCHCQSTTVFE